MAREQDEPMKLDPVVTNPDHYKVVFENEHVRVLDFTDKPGDSTTRHIHPNSVMITLSSFKRRLQAGDRERDIEVSEGTTSWMPAQQFAGKNIGDTPTHVIFVELKHSPKDPDWMDLGPI